MGNVLPIYVSTYCPFIVSRRYITGRVLCEFTPRRIKINKKTPHLFRLPSTNFILLNFSTYPPIITNLRFIRDRKENSNKRMLKGYISQHWQRCNVLTDGRKYSRCIILLAFTLWSLKKSNSVYVQDTYRVKKILQAFKLKSWPRPKKS